MQFVLHKTVQMFKFLEEEAVMTSSNITIASTALQNLLKVERMLHDLLDCIDCADPHLLQR